MMSEIAPPESAGLKCPICGNLLPRGVAADSCPRCLLQAGFSTQTVPLPATTPRLRDLPRPGEQFGHYEIIRLLGQGGMGAVFEAQDLENQRRVALKFLISALDSAESRARFLREGQIAASINHPNSVYVFGTEEIAGVPVIAMELMGGGTLGDRVQREGPLATAAAVDAILQIIAGLEAAARVGLLHRDVKPSNCFIDSNGGVKIGDFGLSIDTNIRSEAGPAGGLFGTPVYCSPEQLRGDSLTVRSDIYAVGATLYYLLTGHTPFESSDVAHLLPLVLEKAAESPAKWRDGIPAGLSRVALRSLDKVPGERFPDYAALRQALLPYTSSALVPAGRGTRFIAGCMDVMVVTSTAFVASNFQKDPGWGTTVIFYAIVVSYFALGEGLAGASLGKAVFGLRVAQADGKEPRLSHVILRSIIFVGLVLFSVDLFGLILGGNSESPLMGPVAILVMFSMMGLVFSTARKRNAFAGVHELFSKTRAVMRSIPRPALSFPASTKTVPLSRGPLEVGPYRIMGALDEKILLGYDPRLMRQVWIRQLPGDAAPLSETLRNVARPTRLRWLNGLYSPSASWAAYEAPAGAPFPEVLSIKHGWEVVRFWLYDLAREVASAQREGSLPAALSLDQIWITEAGTAKLLDFPAPGIPPVPPCHKPADFLRQFAISALEGRLVYVADELTVPIAWSGRTIIDALRVNPSVADQLQPLLQKNATVTRARRMGLLVCAVWFPVFLTLFALVADPEHKVGLLRERLGGLLLVWAYGGYVVMIPGVLAALLFRGGALLRAFGLAVVRHDGRPASRLRILWRTVLAYAPFAILPGLAWQFGIHARWEWLMMLLLALLAALALCSALLPGRSLQDRLAGTCLVPR